MYHYKIRALAVFALLCSLSVSHAALSDAQKLSGIFNFVNQTLFTTAGGTIYSYLNGPTGGIFYTPKFPGSNEGNMTALWGDKIPSGTNATKDEILAHTVGYGGRYVLDEISRTVTHYPSVGTAVTLIGVPQVRHYFWHEDDNLLNLQVIQPNGFLSGTLFWRRAHPLPTTRACDLSISASQTASWISQDTRHTRYEISVTNNGPNSAISATIDVALIGVSLEATTQVSQSPSNPTQYVASLHGLNPGRSYSAGQFQVAGSGTPQFALVSAQC
jgi:hypothetical protein